MKHAIRILMAAIAILSVFAVIVTAQKKPIPTPTPDETERVETEEIKVNALVFDENKKLVEDVGIGDLVITENNVLNQATSVRRIPANVVIVMDTGGELRLAKTIEQTRKTATALIAALRPTDAVAIVQYADNAKIISDLTTNREQTAAAVARTDFGVGSQFLEAVRLAIGLLNRSGVENRHIVLITDGTDDAVFGNARDKALRQVLETDINMHVISYTRLELMATDPKTKRVTSKPQPITADPIGMPREVAEQLPNGARDTRTAPQVGPTISLDSKKLNTWKRRKSDLESAETQLIALTENANGLMIVPETFDEMVAKAPLLASTIDGSYVVTYMPKIPLSEKKGDRLIVVTSKRPGLVAQARRRLVVTKKQ